MRNEMVGAVVRRAMEEPEFRQQLVNDPEETLRAHGFVLEEEDYREIEGLRGDLTGEGANLAQKLANLASRYGINPHGDPLPPTD